jgi:AraC family transcriptional regulator of adaptative response/methylated-DNA-[protein]-cysteine methyltransferase
VGECSLGAILVAATDKGVCAILLGDEPDALVRELQDRFPQAELLGDDPDFARLVATVVGFVEAPGTGLGLPLHVRGTAFQQCVFQALREIPPGSTQLRRDHQAHRAAGRARRPRPAPRTRWRSRSMPPRRAQRRGALATAGASSTWRAAARASRLVSPLRHRPLPSRGSSRRRCATA